MICLHHNVTRKQIQIHTDPLDITFVQVIIFSDNGKVYLNKFNFYLSFINL